MWKRSCIGAWLGALVLLAAPREALAVTVSITPSDTTVAVGDSVEVRFLVDAFADLKGFELVFPYDASRLELLTAAPGEVLTSPGGAYAAFLIPDVTAPADTFRYDGVMLDGTAQGPGILVYARFRVLGSGNAAISCGSSDLRNSLNQSTAAGCAGATVHSRTPDVRISQIYGGGGEDPASPYASDFIELFNADSVTVNLTGWTVQYRFPGDPGWQATALSGSLPPGGYYLVEEAQGGAGGAALPAADAAGSIDLDPVSGTVAVVSAALALADSCPVDPGIADRVGYGSADCFESAPMGGLDHTVAGFRRFDGCQDTGDNLADFLAATPAPRNRAWPLETCRFTLTLSASPPGAGTVTPSPGLASYALGDSVEISASAAPGHVFSGWSGDAAGTDDPLTVVMDGDKNIVALFATDVATHPVVISQVYGAGGEAGADYRNDFIELFNRGSASVDLSDWSVQYAPDSGAAWTATVLAGTIEPGRYYLVQQAAGAGGTLDLPTPDATGTTPMDATDGRVALVRHTAALTDTCPTDPEIEDFVGYGSAACAENVPTPVPGIATAAHRLEAGCVDTDDNQLDFEGLAPAPRNSASPINVCTYWVEVPPVTDARDWSLAASPNPSRGAAVLRFTLPRAGAALLRVYDLQGRTVATLWDGVLQAGPHRAVWNGSTPAGPARSGVYFVRLQAGGRTLQRALVVAR